MTDLTLELPGDHLFIRSVTESEIIVGEARYTRPLIISADEIILDWTSGSIDQLTDSELGAVLDLAPEVVLLGTGKNQVFLHPKRLAEFYRQGVGIEVMTSEAACRTFNVLVSEGRKVVAALLPLQA